MSKSVDLYFSIPIEFLEKYYELYVANHELIVFLAP
jgi:hypothetical protein